MLITWPVSVASSFEYSLQRGERVGYSDQIERTEKKTTASCNIFGADSDCWRVFGN